MNNILQFVKVAKFNAKRGDNFILLFITLILTLLMFVVIVSFDIRIAVAFFIGLSFVIVMLMNYKLSIEVYIALTYLLPFSSRILLYYTQDVQKKDILRGMPDLLLLLLILGYVSKQLYYKEKVIKDPLDWFVLVYIGWNLVEIFNPNTNIVLGAYVGRIIILPMFMYFIARTYFCSLNDIKRFLKLILIFSVCDILYGLGQILLGFTPFDLYAIHTFGWEQMYIWKQPGFIGFNKIFSLSGGSYHLFYPLAIFAILFIGFNNKIVAYFKIDRWKKIFLLLVFILFSFLIERTPIIMFVVGYLITRIDFKSAKSVLKTGAIFIILFSILLISIPLLERTGKFQFHRFAELAKPNSAFTIEWRSQNNWQPARSLISKKPIFGYGLGLFSETMEAARQDKYLLCPESWYYKILLQSGVIGLMLFIALFLKLFKEFTFYIRKNHYFVGFVKALVGITVAILLAGYANHPLEHHLGIFFWFFCGLFVLLKNKELNREIFRHPIDCGR